MEPCGPNCCHYTYHLSSAELDIQAGYFARLHRLEAASAAYKVKKPFSAAKDNQEEKNRLNEMRALRELLLNLTVHPGSRDPIAAYDIDSAIKARTEPTT